MPDSRPRWLRDLIRFLPLRSQFVLPGNVRDQYPVELRDGLVVPMPLVSCLAMELRREGMVHFLAFDPAQGFSLPLVYDLDPQAERDFFAQLLGLSWAENGRAAASAERFFELLEIVVRHDGDPIVVLADFASRLLIRADLPSEAEQRCFTRALVWSHQVLPRPLGPDGRPFFNPVIWIVDKEGDLPDWFLLGNPRMRHIPVPPPGRSSWRNADPMRVSATSSTSPGASRGRALSSFRFVPTGGTRAGRSNRPSPKPPTIVL